MIKYVKLGEVKRLLEDNGFTLYQKNPFQYNIKPKSQQHSNWAIACLVIKPAHNLVIVGEGYGIDDKLLLTAEILRKWFPVKRKILDALQKTGLQMVVITTDDYTD